MYVSAPVDPSPPSTSNFIPELPWRFSEPSIRTDPARAWSAGRAAAGAGPAFFPPPSPGEGPLTATKTSTLRRGRANRAALGFFPHLGLGFVPAPPKIHGNLQI